MNFSKPVPYDLNVFYCYNYFKNRIILIGDACQAIHPIAGQGLNLGIRDAYILANTLEEGLSLGIDFGDGLLLEKYSRQRSIDKNLLVQSTHNLNKLFSNNTFFLSAIRKMGLRIFNQSMFLKKQSMLFAMGLKRLEFWAYFMQILPTVNSGIMTVIKDYSDCIISDTFDS